MISAPIIVCLYWLSLVGIGYALLLLLSRKKNYLGNYANILLGKHPLIILPISFTISSFTFSLLSWFFYIFHLPAFVAVGSYLILLSVSAAILSYFIYPNLLKISVPPEYRQADMLLVTKFALWLMICVIGFDLFVSFITKSNVGGDAIYHMSRALNIINHGFNIRTSSFSAIPEGSYHYNVLYTLYVIPAKLFSLEPMKIWEHSLPFFRLLQWSMVFTLAQYVWKVWLRSSKYSLLLAAVSTISAILIFSGKLFTATYPNQIVVVWITLSVLAISNFITNPRMLAVTLIPLAILTTMTHPIYALVMTVFILYLSAVYIIRSRKLIANLRTISVFISVIAILLIGPIITQLTPSLATFDQISLGQNNIRDIGVLKMADLSLLKPESKSEALVLFSGLVAVLYLLVALRKDKLNWSLILCLSTLPYIVLFLPPLFTMMHVILPVWVLQRFESINIMAYIYCPIAVYAIIQAISRIKVDTNIQGLPLLAWMISTLLISLLVVKSSYADFVRYAIPNQNTYIQNQKVASDFKNILNNDQLTIIDQNYGYMLASMVDIDILAVERGHFPIAADEANRVKCQQHILDNYYPEDLQAISAKFVVVPRAEATSKIYYKVPNKSYLKPAAQNEYYTIYKVNLNNSDMLENKPYAACLRFMEAESKY